MTSQDTGQRAAWSWGSHSLGEAADALWRVADALGSGMEPVSVTVEPPSKGETHPSVELVVREAVDVRHLRQQLPPEVTYVAHGGTHSLVCDRQRDLSDRAPGERAVMGKVGSINEWYRFLAVKSDEEAVASLLTHINRLYRVQDDLRYTVRELSYSPGGDVSASLTIAFNALSEAMDMLESVAARFRAGEREIA